MHLNQKIIECKIFIANRNISISKLKTMYESQKYMLYIFALMCVWCDNRNSFIRQSQCILFCWNYACECVNNKHIEHIYSHIVLSQTYRYIVIFRTQQMRAYRLVPHCCAAAGGITVARYCCGRFTQYMDVRTYIHHIIQI